MSFTQIEFFLLKLRVFRTLVECSNVEGTVVYQKNGQRESDGSDPVGELLGRFTSFSHLIACKHSLFLTVKGPNIFTQYYERPDTTKQSFTDDGWFKTGDLCQYSVEKKKFKMLGRKSQDIIKSGGYKLSALEIESVILGNPAVKDCAIVGVSDEKWGQRVVAIVVSAQQESSEDELLQWAEAKLPKYAVPKEWR